MPRNLIIASYFNTGIDTQRGNFVSAADPRKMMLLFTAVQLRLNVVVLHDHLPDAFCSRFSSDLVDFVRVPSVHSGRTVYTHRHYCAYDYLQSNECGTVFCTGLFDVVAMLNPHSLIDDSHKIWAAIEPSVICQESKGGEWLINEMHRGYGRMHDGLLGRLLLNADIFGGTRQHVLDFLELFIEEMELTKGANTDMPAFNVAGHIRMSVGSVWARGAPLHSEFNKFETRLDVAFLHK
ncbi:MAG TPA: hypothetical protein VGM98_02795 [Schlesneria sp.]|jgi:hypothetical protein